MRSALVSIAALLILVSCASAQRTWVVDWLMRGRADFKDLPQAVLRASDGDTIYVRRHNPTYYSRYTGCDLTKALNLIGEDGVCVYRFGNLSLTIDGIPATKRVSVRNIQCEGQLTIRNCQGEVTLDAIGQSFYALARWLVITKSSSVSVTNSVLNGVVEPAISAIASSVSLNGCEVWGQSAYSGTVPGSPAIYCQASALDLSGCKVYGGDSFSSTYPGWPGIVSVGSSMTVTGDSSALIWAGQWPTTHAIQTTGGSVLLDPAVRLLDGMRNRDAVAGSAAVVVTRIPCLTGNSGSLGTNLDLALVSPALDPFLTLVARPGPDVPTVWGRWSLDPSTVAVLDSGVQGASERHVLSLPVPPTPALSGLALAFQTLSGTSRLLLSPVFATVLR